MKLQPERETVLISFHHNIKFIYCIHYSNHSCQFSFFYRKNCDKVTSKWKYSLNIQVPQNCIVLYVSTVVTSMTKKIIFAQ